MIAIVLCLPFAAGYSQVWQTSLAGDRLAALGRLVWYDAPPPEATLTVQADFSSVRQTIVGFGGAITESAAYNFAALSPGNKTAAASALFGSPDMGGNGLTMARVAINSPDFALSDYSYANITGDYNLTAFDHNLTRDGMYVVPMINAAKTIQPVIVTRHGRCILATGSPQWKRRMASPIGGLLLKTSPLRSTQQAFSGTHVGTPPRAWPSSFGCSLDP